MDKFLSIGQLILLFLLFFPPYKNGALRMLYMVKKILSQLELVFSNSISFEDYNSDYALKIQLPLGTDEYLLSLKWMIFHGKIINF